MMRKFFLIFGLLFWGSLAFGQNNAPVALDDYVTDYGDVNSIFLLDNDYDPDGDDLTLTIVVQPNHITASVGYHSWYDTYITSFILNTAFVGSDSLTYQVCDNTGLCDLAKLYITILPSSPPIAVDDTLITFENKIVVGDFRQNDIDVDNQSLYMSLNSPPIHGNANVFNGTSSYLPDSGFVGLDSFYYNVCDEFSGYNQLCDVGKVYVNVLPNTAPVAVNDTVSDCSNFSFSPIYNDYDNTGNFWIDTNLVIAPSNGSIKFEYYWSYWRYYSDTINPTEIQDSLAYRICDYNGLCDTAWVFFNISPTDFLQLDSISYTNEICNDGEGEILFHSSAYQPFMTYTLNDNLITYNNPHFTNLDTGIYYPTIKNGSCVKELSPITITQSAAAPIFNNLTLFNNNLTNPDTLIISASSSSSALEYSVNGGITWQSSDTFPSLSSGTYEVMARSSNSCEVPYPYNPVIFSSLDTNMNIKKVHHFGISDCGMNNGFIAIQTIGTIGTSSTYQYTIDSGITWVSNSIFTNLSPNTYHIAVRNSITLEANHYAVPIVIEARVEPIIDSITVINPTASNTSDGTITINAHSPLGTPLVYSLDGGINWQSSSVFSSLHSGTYIISVRHTDGTCEVLWGTIFLNINTANPPTNLSVNTTDATSCTSNNGTIDVSVDNSQNYLYSIDNGQNWQTDSLFQNVKLGYYNLYLKEISSNNVFTAYSTIGTIEVSSPMKPSITNVTSTPPTSCNASDATITINTTGGNGNLIYAVNGGNWQSSNVITGLDDGNYTVKVKNSDFTCLEILSGTQITDSLAPVIYLVDVVHPYECNNGSITILGSTLSGNALEYSIDDGNNWSSNNTFNNLNAANYNVKVRNVGTTCEASRAVTLYGYHTLQNISITHTDPTTCNSNDGTITITPFDTDYEYALNSVLTGSWSSNNTFTGLPCGNYNVFVRRQNGHCSTNVGTVSLNANNFITTVNHTNLTGCTATDGTITIQTIANNNLEYSIDNGMTWLTNNGTFTNLDTGSYHVLVREIGTMNIDTFANNPVVITAPAMPTITSVNTNEFTCEHSITIFATGSSLEYSIDGGTTWQTSNNFQFLTVGTYYVMVRNSDGSCPVSYVNNPVILATTNPAISPSPYATVQTFPPSTCGGSDGMLFIYPNSGSATEYSVDDGVTWQTSEMFSGLSEGAYSIMYRDTFCQVSYINNPVILSSTNFPVIDSISTTNPSNCGVNDGSIIVHSTGVNLEYSIDGGINWQPINTFSGLAAGTYLITIRNTNGTCQVNANNPTILIVPNAPSITNVSITNPTDCGVFDGTITVTAIGGSGSGSYEYSIDGGADWTNTTGIFTGLAAGIYQIRVRNAVDNSCQVSYPDVTLTAPNPPTITNVTFTNPTSCGVNDGTITITASGIDSLQYSIDGGTTWQPYIPGLITFPNTSNTFTGLVAGTYQVRVRNIDGTCLVSDSDVILTPQNPLGLTITSTNTFCGANNGTATVFPTGGTAPYTYMWDNGIAQSTSTITNLAPGTYYVTITDAVGCTDTASVTISSTSFPTITNVTTTNVSACGANDGIATVNYTGGISPYTYLWNSGQTSQTITNLNGGNYFVAIMDVNGCMDTLSTTVSGFVSPNITNITSTNPTDCGINDGTITINIINSTGQELYTIDSGVTWQSSNIFTGLAAGTYNATHIGVTNTSSNCNSFYTGNSIVLTAPILPTINTVNITQPTICSGTGTVQIIATGNSLEYSIDGGITWQTTNIFNNLPCGNYDIAVRNSDGTCMVIYGQVILNVPFSITNVNTQDKICGQQEGKINITAQDGTGNYQYSIDSGLTWQSVDSFTNLTANNYYVFVTDGVDTLAFANNPVTIQEVGTPTLSAIYGGDLIFLNSTPNTNVEYSVDCGTTWQTNPMFQPVSGTIFCSAVRYTDGSCPLFSTDTFVNTLPIAIDDSISFPKSNVETFNILNNDTDAESNNLYVTNTPQTINIGLASVTVDSLGNVTVPTMNFNFGTYTFDYTICESYNPTHCDTAIVQFTIYPPSNHIYDTIAIGATHQLCLPNNLGGTITSLTNVCGTIPNIVIDSIVGQCLYLYADNYGDATTCVVMCDNLGNCDTTFLHFNVQDGVWPGDTDDDTYVNNFDLLNIGLAYGTSGTPRDSVTTVWNGYITPLWNISTPNSNIDYRHADCNGDGIINSTDTLAILQNYNLSYQRGGGGSVGVPLQVEIDTNFVVPHFSLPISLGDLTTPATAIYGGAFSILYDTSLIKKDSVFVTFDNSWVGVNHLDMIGINKNFGDYQQIDAAFTRIDGIDVSGFGQIGTLNFTIKDDILQRGLTVDSVIFIFNIINTKFIDKHETEIPIATQTTNWVVTNTQNLPIIGKEIKVFPNPTSEVIHIQSPNLGIDNIIITDIVGQIVLQKTPNNNRNIQLNINDLKTGVYYLQLETEKGQVVRKLVIL